MFVVSPTMITLISAQGENDCIIKVKITIVVIISIYVFDVTL